MSKILRWFPNAMRLDFHRWQKRNWVIWVRGWLKSNVVDSLLICWRKSTIWHIQVRMNLNFSAWIKTASTLIWTSVSTTWKHFKSVWSKKVGRGKSTEEIYQFCDYRNLFINAGEISLFWKLVHIEYFI